MIATNDNHGITPEELAIQKLSEALNDYLMEKETATQMEETIEYAIKVLDEHIPFDEEEEE